MRPLSPIHVLETIEPTGTVLNPCEIHASSAASATATAGTTPGATLLVQVDSAATQAPVTGSEVRD